MEFDEYLSRISMVDPAEQTIYFYKNIYEATKRKNFNEIIYHSQKKNRNKQILVLLTAKVFLRICPIQSEKYKDC